MDWGAEYIGTTFLVAGALLALRRRKRQFDRTNQFGIEQFSSFWGKLGSKIEDAFIGGTSWTLLSGGLLILAFRYQDSWGWVMLLPVLVVVLFFLFFAS